MKRHAESHLDHGLTAAQVDHILTRFADRAAFFVETFELPEDLGTVPCGLFGPRVGDAPIAEGDVLYAPRGTRRYASRLVERAPRPTRTVTVIAGPHAEPCDPAHHWPKQCVLCEGTGTIKHACILYTVFGGPVTPKEPQDPTLADDAKPASAAFWADHALAK